MSQVFKMLSKTSMDWIKQFNVSGNTEVAKYVSFYKSDTYNCVYVKKYNLTWWEQDSSTEQSHVFLGHL